MATRFTDPDNKLCRWFALCHNVATGTLEHPILPPVPICDRCRAKDAKIREDTRGEGN